MPQSCVWHDSFVCVTCLSHVCDMTHSYVWHASVMCVTWLIIAIHREALDAGDMTPACVRHDSCMCATWLIHVCHMHHSYVWCLWHDSFICVTWLVTCVTRLIKWDDPGLTRIHSIHIYICMNISLWVYRLIFIHRRLLTYTHNSIHIYVYIYMYKYKSVRVWI